jgi:hypothetical protein
VLRWLIILAAVRRGLRIRVHGCACGRHPWLKSSGYIGQSAGLLALRCSCFSALPPRKKFRWLSFTGAIARWLDAHVIAALGPPLP